MKNIRKLFAMALAIIMMMGLSATAFAVETLPDNTLWYGDQVIVNAEPGVNGYDFYLVEEESGKLYSYEMSNHMVTNGTIRTDSAKGYYASQIPQLFMLVDAKDGLTDWSPKELYSFGKSDYQVLYCCDVGVNTRAATRYMLLNLEDSEYYDAEAAAHIRAIVSNAYPYISLEQMKENLVAAKVEGAADLTRAEILSAVQTAIWGYANGDANPPVRYSHTFHVPLTSTWGNPMHEFTNEIPEEDIWWEAQAASYIAAKNQTPDDYNEKGLIDVPDDGIAYGVETEKRINALIAYLKGLTATYPEAHQIKVSKLEITDVAPVIGQGDTYQVALQLALNNSGSSELDEIAIDVYVNDSEEAVLTKDVKLGTNTYDLLVEAPAGAVIKAVVSGSQILPVGAYFYAPSAREESQSLVGVAEGETSVYADGSVTLKQDEEVVPATATLNLKKVNEAGKALTGAEFALYVNTTETSIFVGTYAVDENGQLTIGNLLPNNYELRETKAPAGYAADATVAFTVTEEGEIVSETAEIAKGETGFEVEVINYLLPAPPAPETTEVYVAKQWVGDTAETRPASVDVQLLRNGVVYDTVTLTANNGWSARWFNLDIDATWTVAEASVPAGYTASVAQNGNSFVITNTFGVELPEPPVPLQPSVPSMGDFFIDEEDVPLADVPATGDPLTVMAAMSALSAAGVYFTRKKRDEE